MNIKNGQANKAQINSDQNDSIKVDYYKYMDTEEYQFTCNQI